MPPSAPGATPPDALAPLLAGLEPAQQEAVLANEPVVCVLAGAGAGKTRVLTLRVARRLEDGSAHPTHVLVCTFSRKAAEELRSRLWTLGAGDGVTAGTFHRTALRLVGRYRADRGEPAPVVGDRRSLLAAMLRGDELDGSRAGTTPTRQAAHASRAGTPRTGRAGGARMGGARELARLDAEIGWAKARLVSPSDYEAAARQAGRRSGMAPGRVAELYERYEAVRRRRGVMDLDDLLWHCGDLLATDPAFARAVRWWHRHLFVDEAQDMNEAQYRMLCLLVGEDPDLFAVGDPNQSVYGWNGADPRLLRRITDEFAGTRVVRLDANHRCTPQVVTAATAVLDPADVARPVSTRPDGPLPRIACLTSDAEEAAWVARNVWLAHRPGRRWSSIAVLARTNAQLDRMAAALEAERVPYRIAGGELGPASDVSGAKDPTAPSAGPGAHSATIPSGASTRSRPTLTREARHDGAGEAMDDAGTDDTGTDDTGTDDTAMDDAGPSGRRARSRTAATGDGLESGHGTGAPGGSVPGDGRLQDDRVVLSTFHRAKGLQWPVVFVTGLADGTVPLLSARTRAARAEERRLLYVALTRAEDELVCTWARHGEDLDAARGCEPRSPCPWLEPLQRAVDELRQSQAVPTPERVAERLSEIRRLLPSGAGGQDRGSEGW